MDLERLIEHGQRRERIVRRFQAAGVATALVLGGFWVALWLDITWHLSMPGRLLACATIGLLLATAVLYLLRRFRSTQLTADQVALAVERRSPGDLENRLINAVQLSREKRGDGELVRAVVRENEDRLTEAPLEQPLPSWPAWASMFAAGALIALGGIFWALTPDAFRNAASRILLPLAHIEPLFATTLDVRPGSITVRPGTRVTIDVRIRGRVPGRIVLLADQAGRKTTDQRPLAPQARTAQFTLEPLTATTTYIVAGGDFTSARFTIEVPTPLVVEQLRATLHYPSYTRLADRRAAQPGGDLEVLAGSTGRLEWTLSVPAQRAWLVGIPPAASNTSKQRGQSLSVPKRVPLEKIGARAFAAPWRFAANRPYRIEIESPRGTVVSPAYTLRAVADESPRLELTGVEPEGEILIDSVLPLAVAAHDDIGLARVGLFWRPEAKAGAAEGAWHQLRSWQVADAKREFRAGLPLSFAALEAVEGDALELVARGADTDPQKRGRWIGADPIRVRLTAASATLHILYRRILESEAALTQLNSEQDRALHATESWIRKFDPSSGLRWDDPKTLRSLATAVREQAAQQAKLRTAGARLAHSMVAEAGRLSLSVSMLSDTEIVRATAILEAVMKRELPQDKKTALADARLTQQRILRSLAEVREQYTKFRQEWETTHMLSYTKQLAERQGRMADLARQYGRESADVLTATQRTALARRQKQLAELALLGQKAYLGIGQREALVGPILAAAYRAAATQLDSLLVERNMQQGATDLAAGNWTSAAAAQRQAADALVVIYNNLRKAQTDAAQQALKDLKQLAEEHPKDQKDIKQLERGTSENLVKFKPEELDLAETIELRRMADELRGKRLAKGQDKTFDYLFEEHMKGMLEPEFVKGRGQDFSKLTLAKTPSGQMSFPNSDNRKANRVKAAVQEKVKDLVGDLLEEADDLRDKYETYNLNAAFQTNEPGDVGKQGGDLNSTAASAATGNMKQPTQNFGGVSRSGRLGARAHGLIAGDRSVNRRGRDEAQQGQEDVARQSGLIKQTMSGDPQKDTSTGRGGKLVDAEQTAFSTKDAGQWKDEDVEAMGKPQQQFQIVERKGKPLDPRVADMMRDLSSRQEQVIARIQAVKKELDQLYLPSDHLEDLMAQLGTGLDRLAQQPDAEAFRKQIELLDRLAGTVVVFERPTTEYLRGPKHKQVLRGDVLDAPPASVLPGYEDAVEQYYRRLSGAEEL